MTNPCPLCQLEPNDVVWTGRHWTLIRANQPDFPGYVRLVCKRHVKEMSDLTDGERQELYRDMLIIERSMIKTLCPEKVNWAQFGNMVPHVHWHAIPRWRDDSRFPLSCWEPAQRMVPGEVLSQRKKRAEDFYVDVALCLEKGLTAQP